MLSGTDGDAPDVTSVVPDGAVGGKDARPGDVDEGHAVPLFGVAVSETGALVGSAVALKIGQKHILIGGGAKEQAIGDVLIGRAVAEAAGDLVQNGMENAVAAVILNRVEHSDFPDTVSSVIYQSGAFDAVMDGQINLTPSDSAIRAAKDALNGWDPTGGAIYYYNPRTATNQWIRTRPIITTIGQHVFCE